MILVVYLFQMVKEGQRWRAFTASIAHVFYLFQMKNRCFWLFSYLQVVKEGQWWRAFTASIYHINLIHLGFNMISVCVCVGRWVRVCVLECVYVDVGVGVGVGVGECACVRVCVCLCVCVCDRLSPFISISRNMISVLLPKP